MNRDEILLAAAHIFSQKGYHATSMHDIAQAVSLQKASLYHHVASKQDILLELWERALDLLIERLALVIDQPLPPDEKLRQAMISYVNTLTEHQELASVLLLENRSLEPELQGAHFPRRQRFEWMWRGLIQQGVEAGVFNCSDSSIAAKALLGTMNWTITWYRSQGRLSGSEISEYYADLFLQGLVARASGNGSANGQ